MVKDALVESQQLYQLDMPSQQDKASPRMPSKEKRTWTWLIEASNSPFGDRLPFDVYLAQSLIDLKAANEKIYKIIYQFHSQTKFVILIEMNVNKIEQIINDDL